MMSSHVQNKKNRRRGRRVKGAKGASNQKEDAAKKEKEAKNARLGMWRYGDVDDDDDAPEFGFRRPTPAAASGAAPNAWGKK